MTRSTPSGIPKRLACASGDYLESEYVGLRGFADAPESRLVESPSVGVGTSDVVRVRGDRRMLAELALVVGIGAGGG